MTQDLSTPKPSGRDFTQRRNFLRASSYESEKASDICASVASMVVGALLAILTARMCVDDAEVMGRRHDNQIKLSKVAQACMFFSADRT